VVGGNILIEQFFVGRTKLLADAFLKAATSAVPVFWQCSHIRQCSIAGISSFWLLTCDPLFSTVGGPRSEHLWLVSSPGLSETESTESSIGVIMLKSNGLSRT
jgi:hypothetical protein